MTSYCMYDVPKESEILRVKSFLQRYVFTGTVGLLETNENDVGRI
jgi:hypothetical protein